MGQVDANPTFFAFSGTASGQSIDVLPVMMFCLFAAMVVFALFVNRLMKYEINKRRETVATIHFKRSSHASLFEPPMRWLAVRTQNPRLVQSALGVQNPRACT